MTITPELLEKLKQTLTTLPEFHPADYYNTLIKTPQANVKAMAAEYGMYYNNKRFFAKQLIEKLVYVKDNLI